MAIKKVVKGHKTRSKKCKTVTQNEYMFEKGESAIYVGGLYNEYKHTQVDIIDRVKEGDLNYYTVVFNDGIHKEILESVLRKVEVDVNEM